VALFAWESVNRFATLILVEGLFDLAVLWQAGFPNTTCAIGLHLTQLQWQQLASRSERSIYIAFDQDENQAGQQASLLALKATIQLFGRLPSPCCSPNRISAVKNNSFNRTAGQVFVGIGQGLGARRSENPHMHEPALDSSFLSYGKVTREITLKVPPA
jgi:hypothetical protein